MDKELKREARKQYFKYFTIWFVGIAILAVVYGIVAAGNAVTSSDTRGNNSAPAERVYDYADVLTDEEEQKLREHIALREAEYHIDLVLVTLNEEIESQGNWETVMMNKADDFYEQKYYGYNKIHGDGALLLDNWYSDVNGSQAGSWLSTCGVVLDRMNDYEIDRVLDEVYYQVEDNPYRAYKAYVDKVCHYASEKAVNLSMPWWFILACPLVVAIVFAISKLTQRKAPVTTNAKTYVEGGRVVVTNSSDNFLRKNVVRRRIETSSSSGGRSGGGGGMHRSSGGVRHGGGGRRR